MSDLLSSLSGSSSTSSLDSLVSAYKKTQQEPIDKLKERKTALEKRQVFFTSLRTKLESLSSSASNFADSTSSLSKFLTKKASSSDTSIATVSASSSAALGSNTLKVNRLASSDLLVSDRTTLADSAGYTAGTKTFDITANGTTKTVSVTFDGTETKEKALSLISSAINSTTDIGVTAGVVRDTSSTGRLTLSAKSSGTNNSISFSDPDGVLSQLGISGALNADANNRTVFSSTTAGYLRSNSSELNASFQINGIDVVRGSNTISDVVDGLTITLSKAQDASADPITLTTSADEQGAVSNVSPLLDSLNWVIAQLNDEATTYKDDFAMRSFRSSIRQISSSEFEGTYKYLSDVGITADDNGKLSVSNSKKFRDAVTNNPADVAKLFDGFSDKITATVGNLLGDNGLISSRSTSISSQIKSIGTRTTELEKRVDNQADSLRKQYETVMSLYIKAQQQFTLISSSSSG